MRFEFKFFWYWFLSVFFGKYTYWACQTPGCCFEIAGKNSKELNTLQLKHILEEKEKNVNWRRS